VHPAINTIRLLDPRPLLFLSAVGAGWCYYYYRGVVDEQDHPLWVAGVFLAVLLAPGYYWFRRAAASEAFQKQKWQQELPESYFTYTGRQGIRRLVFPAAAAASSWNPYYSGSILSSSIMFVGSSPRHTRSNSVGSRGSDDGSHQGSVGKPLDEPVLVYHESARSIVFRDHLRRAVRQNSSNTTDHEEVIVERGRVPSERGVAGEVEEYTHLAQEILDPSETASPLQAGLSETQIAGFQPRIVPLAPLKLGPNDEYQALLESRYDAAAAGVFTPAESEVCERLQQQKCTVKTIKNVDWTSFLQRFQTAQQHHHHTPLEHDDHAPSERFPFNSFVTSCSLLPPEGRKMRCYGSPNQYTVGVVFALPDAYADAAAEDEAAARTQTWSWPAGYSVRASMAVLFVFGVAVVVFAYDDCGVYRWTIAMLPCLHHLLFFHDNQ